MKPLVKLCMMIFSGLMLFGCYDSSSYASMKSSDTLMVQQTLKEANALFLEGNRTMNSALMQQAKDKFSLWIAANKKSHDKKTVAHVLRSRASVSIALGEYTAAIFDYQTSNEYDPIGEIQLGVCFLNKKTLSNSIDLAECYQKAVDIFIDNNTDATNSNYLLARILSGDKSAIVDYKNLIASTEDKWLLDTYKLAIKEYLDKSTCREILPDCK